MKEIVIATRGSDLALWQARHVQRTLQDLRKYAKIRLLVLQTKGDKIVDVTLSKVGGKGLFVKEIEDALLTGAADIAVHSMKDLPFAGPESLHIAAVTKRATPWDAWVSTSYPQFKDLPKGGVVGTSSLRRQSQLLAARPDLQVTMLRGNVPTRVKKLDKGEYAAIVLAACGLQRLGLEQRIGQLLSKDLCLPAVGQGALAVQTRKQDTELSSDLRQVLHCEQTGFCITAERSFMKEMGGSCHTPIAGYACIDGAAGEKKVLLRGRIASEDGSKVDTVEMANDVELAQELGKKVASRLKEAHA